MAANAISPLQDYEQQYSLQTAEVTAKIGKLSTIEASQRVSHIHEVQKLLLDVSELLEQMEVTVRDLPQGSGERSKYELRVRSYRSDKKMLDGELEKAVQRLREHADRDELLALDESLQMDQQEEQLIEGTQRLERSSRKLQDAYRIAIETEEIGTEVLGNLGSQRETLTRARERLREADADLGRSSRLLNQMLRRVIQNRLLLLITAVFLLFCLLFIVYKAV